MVSSIPLVDDCSRIMVLVKHLDVGMKKFADARQYESEFNFNRVLEKLRALERISITDCGPLRYIRPVFVTELNSKFVGWSEFQAFRRPFGLLCVACSSRLVGSSSEEDEHEQSGQFSLLCQLYLQQKTDMKPFIFDSRLILFGFTAESVGSAEHFREGEMLCYDDKQYEMNFELDVKEMLKSIFWVLEGKRLDLSFENLDAPPCPLVPKEEKYRVGLENKTSKQYRRKCVGRLRKQVGDYALLTDQPAAAAEAYSAAIEVLKPANDWLWLAGAYEGWACAALTVKLCREQEASSRARTLSKGSLQRVATFTDGQMREEQGQVNKSFPSPFGHQRTRSDERGRTVASVKESQSMGSISLSAAAGGAESRLAAMPPTEIIDRYRLALDNYEKFSFAAHVEYECVLHASNLFLSERRYYELEVFLRDQMGKYLDDNFRQFDAQQKSEICQTCASIFDRVGFCRKAAFYLRLSVLFRLQLGGAAAYQVQQQQQDQQATPTTDQLANQLTSFREVYPVLYKSMKGYDIPESILDMPRASDGSSNSSTLQIRALHELYFSALRAGYIEAALRHLCYILQGFLERLDQQMVVQFCQELPRLAELLRPKCRQSQDERRQSIDEKAPLSAEPVNISIPLNIPHCGITLPPVPMDKFPAVRRLQILPLPNNLAPKLVKSSVDSTWDLFVYTPFVKKEKEIDRWVVGCECGVALKVKNLLHFDLKVSNVKLFVSGVEFEAQPIDLLLPPDSLLPAKLMGVPKTAGTMTILGYSCEVVSVKNAVQFLDVHWLKKSSKAPKSWTPTDRPTTRLEMEVLPPLPVLALRTSLSGSLDANELTVYSGQTFDYSISLKNVSVAGESFATISSVELELSQPAVAGGPLLVELLPDGGPLGGAKTTLTRNLHSMDCHTVKFRVNGVDPMAVIDEPTKSSEADETQIRRRTSLSNLADAAPGRDQIPYTGRLLTATFAFEYVCGGGGDNETEAASSGSGVQYSRRVTSTLCVTIVPALTVAEWAVLPGDQSRSRYLVLDIANHTDQEAELQIEYRHQQTGLLTKTISVQAKDLCRVPLLCPCCEAVSATMLRWGEVGGDKPWDIKPTVLQMEEFKRAKRQLSRHLAAHCDIRWFIPSLGIKGVVPVGPLLASLPLLKKLAMPSLSVGVRVNGQVCSHGQDERQFTIGERISLQVDLENSGGERPYSGQLTLRCFQDLQNKGLSTIDQADHFMFVGPESVPFWLDKSARKFSSAAAEATAKVLRDNEEEEEDEGDGKTEGENFCCTFDILFIYEGSYKVVPQLDGMPDEELFLPTLSFQIVTKAQ